MKYRGRMGGRDMNKGLRCPFLIYYADFRVILA